MATQDKRPVLDLALLSPEDRATLERYRKGVFTEEELREWAAGDAAFGAELRKGAGDEKQARAQSRACNCLYNAVTDEWDRTRPCPEHTKIG